MFKLKIQHIAKNGSSIGQPIEVETSYVPRVGEIIDSESIIANESNKFFIVTSIVHKATKSNLTPYITVKNWYKGIRSDLLGEYSWLPDTPTGATSFDEDDYNRIHNIEKFEK